MSKAVLHLTLRASFLLGIAVAHLASVESAAAQEFATPADSAAIMAAFQNWERGWELYDPEFATRDYSDDADWTNAFGMRRIGRDSTQALLTEVFRISAVTAGETRYEFPQS